MHGILLVDKPRGWTSHDVVNWVRKRLRTRWVGHGGTLDPAAEGLLLIAVGIATRLIQYAIDADKSYVAHIVLGVSTTTDDLEGQPSQPSPASQPPSLAQLHTALERFRGLFEQRPPSYSAVKIGGTPAYRRAREQIPTELRPRTVFVRDLQCLHYDYPDLIVSIDCSKGFYVRSLARDLGALLGTGGYLHGLVRTRIGTFTLNEAWSLLELERCLTFETWPLLAQHPDMLVSSLPVLLIPEQQITAWYHGAPVRSSEAALPETFARAYAPDGTWGGIARYDANQACWRSVLVHNERR